MDTETPHPTKSTQAKYRRAIWFSLVILGLGVLYYFLAQSGFIALIADGAALKQKIQALGAAGPLIIISAMTLAIVMSPIPSAPIALASGAIYGHTEGSIYILIGSELGAIIAFFIARLLGVDVLQKWIGKQPLTQKMLGSPQKLMFIIFVSRLLPFISFDLISYAAGLTSLSFWRFAIATLAGIAPASFLLGHFGANMSSGDSSVIAYTLLALGLISAVMFFINKYRQQ